MKKKISIFLIILIIISCFSLTNVMAFDITAKGAILIDAETGDVLYEKNAEAPRVPASMTKVMALYIMNQELEKGTFTKDTVIPISDHAAKISRDFNYPATVPLNQDEVYTADELMQLIWSVSASASVLAMAEFISGSEEEFVKRMNEQANQWQIDATYYDCMGIASNKVSPHAMATIARRIISDYPDIFQYTIKPKINFHGQSYDSTNRLLLDYFYEGADGLKTGTTNAAGYCFCGTAERNGVRLISVVMASSSTTQRFVDTQNLFDYGFNLVEQNIKQSQIIKDTKLSFSNIPEQIRRFVPFSININLQTPEDIKGYTAQWIINGRVVKSTKVDSLDLQLDYTLDTNFDGDIAEIEFNLINKANESISSKISVPILNEQIEVSGNLGFKEVTMYRGNKLVIPCTVNLAQDLNIQIAAKWQLNGQDIYLNETFNLNPYGYSEYIFEASNDLEAGDYIISFVINPYKQKGIEYKEFKLIIHVI